MKKKKTVGIITMHRVVNCGSALQAYALQRIIRDMGFEAELIDYIYPNKYHKSLHKVIGIKGYAKEFYGFILRLWNRLNFRSFYKKFFVLSEKCYPSKEDLMLSSPRYDIYVSGSDQVWNPKSIAYDTSFMLSWVKDGKKVAYSGSFATTTIPEEYKETYSAALSKYDSLSVREESSLSILKDLSGKTAEFVLDPALLLDSHRWNDVINDASVEIAEEYILVYILGYSFNAYPYALELINYLEEKYKKQIVVLAMSRTYVPHLHSKKIIHNINPQNFLSLIAKASLVITDSFHATAMSINFQIPFYSLVLEKLSNDNRVYSLLLSLNAEDRAVEKGCDFDKLPPFVMDFSKVNEKLVLQRERSIDYLKRTLL